MDTLLLVVTALAVVVAAATSTLAWRVMRAERQRRSARIAALAAAADVDVLRAGMRADTAHDSAALDEFMPASASVSPSATPASGAIVSSASATPTPPPPGLFGQAVPDSGSGNRQYGLLAAAAVVAVLVGAGGLLLISGRAPVVSGAEVRVPLELVALGHERVGGQLAVSGVVLNPASGSPVRDLEAHVRAFDAAGLMITSRSTALSVTALAPGQQVPFVVELGEATTAARYRVSFAAGGAILAHVDRRTNLPAAVTAEARGEQP